MLPIPRITTDTVNTIPQAIEKTKAKEICKGKAEWDEQGNIKSCSKGYYRYDQNYQKQERAYTWKEKIINFLRKLSGLGFIGIIAVIILCPSLVGVVLGRFIEGAFGVGKNVLTSVAKAIQKARKQGVDLDQALEIELDKEEKKYIKNLKDRENIK
jgi:hypothetical protein